MNTAPLSLSDRIRFGAEAVPFFLFMGLFRLIGLERASALGSWIGRHIFSLLPPDRVARANLLKAFPEKSQAERDAIRMQMWDNLGRVVAEYPHLEKFSPFGDDPRITITAPHDDWLESYRDQSVMYLSAHLANWEMMPVLSDRLSLAGASVVRPPNNPYVANWIARQRLANGPGDLIDKHNAMRRMLARLRDGKSLYMLIDQKLREGIAVPFFGRPAMTTPAPAAIALKTGTKIIIVSNRRTHGSRFNIVFHGEFSFTPSENEADDIPNMTAALTAQIEEIIRADPGQWLWIHNRWPKDTR
jgi:KDO2-lipid IV(A) lauroyltransferase